MTVMHVNRNKHTLPISNQPLVLRNGQIVQGEILKIYPDNKAEIRIGTHRFIAETNTPLVIGKRYFFQVSENQNQVIQLKVIADAMKQNVEQNLLQLLDKLGLKANRQVMQFLQTLLNDKIPFTRQQLSQAMNILSSSSIINQDLVAMDVLKEMFVKRFPINENVFRALFSVKTNQFAPLIHQLTNEIQKQPPTEINKQLQNLLEQLFSRPQKNEYSVKHLPTQTISKSELALILQSVARNIFSNESSPISERVAQIVQFLFPSENKLTLQQLSEHIMRLMDHATKIKARAVELLNQIPSTPNGNMTNEQLNQIEKQVQMRFLPLLPESIQHGVFSLQNNFHENQNTMNPLLQILSDDRTYQLLERTLHTLQQGGNEANQFHTLSKSRFLSYIQQFIQSSGMLNEHQFKLNVEQLLVNRNEQPLQQIQSIKTLILNLLLEGNSIVNEKAQPIIHFINGLQLQSVYESHNLLQATLQLPGERFALPKDIFLQFEGKKNEDGKLDPSHCRILFVLHLQNISETVIDMFVQKRIVTITIYNDKIKQSNLTKEKLIPLLTKQLNELNFQLSSVKWKSLSEHQNQPKGYESKTVIETRKEGFDFRI